jgi:hypothetical protein
MTMTEQELYDNYRFKVVKRALMREFPFIKNVSVKDPADIDKYKKYIFLDVDINPYEMSQMYGLKIDPIANRYLRRGEPYWAPFLSMFVKGDVEESYPIKKAINDLVNSVQKSTALPQEFKLDQELDIGSYHASPDTVPSDIMSGMNSY